MQSRPFSLLGYLSVTEVVWVLVKVKTKDINSPNVPVVVKEVKIDEEVESSFGREGVEEKTRDWSPNVETEIRDTRKSI